MNSKQNGDQGTVAKLKHYVSNDSVPPSRSAAKYSGKLLGSIACVCDCDGIYRQLEVVTP